MDKFKRLFNKAKWLKKAGILTLVLTMLLTMFNNGVLIKADDNVNANINFTSQIVEQINGSYVSISDVQSGKSFFLAIGYTISASGETSRYTNCTLSITLPSYVSFSGQTSDIQGTAFDEINYNINFEGTPYEERTLTITADELVPGQTGTLYLQMSFDNLKTPDGKKSVWLEIQQIGTLYYCVLNASYGSGLGTYNIFKELPKAVLVNENGEILVDTTNHAFMIVNLDYTDGYTTVFEVRYRNGLFGLQVYFEEDSTIEEVVE